MVKRRGWMLLLGAVGALGSLGAGVSYHKTRPGYLCGIPDYDYVHGNPKGPVSVFSLDAIPVMRTPPSGDGLPSGLVRERVKYFQLSQRVVTLDHCSLSRVVLVLHESGQWTLSMQADQNPWMTGPNNEVTGPVQPGPSVSAVRSPAPELEKQTAGLKRNLFTVRVRCLGDYPVLESQPALAPGKPVLVELAPDPFWVQRGCPFDFWKKESAPALSNYFDLIDRVEVEFSYR